jgi:hypothetical protein
MKLPQLILAFIATICLIFAGNALAQTDINLNNTDLIRFFLINLFGLGVILLWQFDRFSGGEAPPTKPPLAA